MNSKTNIFPPQDIELTESFILTLIESVLATPDTSDAKNSTEVRLDSDIGIKYDSDKPRPSLVPFDSLMEVVKVLEFGAKKYGVENWKKVTPPNRYYDAVLRHLFAWKQGENLDPETGISHFAHAATGLLFLIHFQLSGKI